MLICTDLPYIFWQFDNDSVICNQSDPIGTNQKQIVDRASVCVYVYLFDFIHEGIDEMLDLWGLSWEQDQFLIGQSEFQHVFAGDGYKQNICIAAKTQ